MKYKLISIESSYDDGDSQQYRLEVKKEGWLRYWIVADRFYATDPNDAYRIAEYKLERLRLGEEVVKE